MWNENNEGLEHDLEFNELEELEAYSPQDRKHDSPEVMRSLLNKQCIDHLIDSFLRWHHSKGASSDAALVRTFRTIKSALQNYMRDFHKRNNMTHHQKNTASNLVLSTKGYPMEIRMKMLKALDENKYQDVIELAASYDMKNRDRPHANKQGPKDPLAIKGDVHIDWKKVVDPKVNAV